MKKVEFSFYHFLVRQIERARLLSLNQMVLFLLVSLSVLLMSMRSDCITGDGCFRGKKLAGKVRVVDVGEDFKVRIVTVGEDLKVRVDECASSSSEVGRWRFVPVGEDFRIRFVTVGEDFKIRFDDVSNGVSRPCR